MVQILTPDQTKLRVRLYGIHAPKTQMINHKTRMVNKNGQLFGEEAEEALRNMIEGKQVRLDIMDIDKYKCMVGVIWLNQANFFLEQIR